MMLTLCIISASLSSFWTATHQPWAVVLPSHMNWIVRVKDSFPSRKVLRKLLRETYSSALAKWSNSFFFMPGSKVPDIAQLPKTTKPPKKKTPGASLEGRSPSFGPHSPSVSGESSQFLVSQAAWPWTFAQIFQLRKPSPTDVTQPIRLWPRPDLALGCGPTPTLHDILHMGPSGAKAGANWGSLIIIQTWRYGWKLYNIHHYIHHYIHHSYIRIHTYSYTHCIAQNRHVLPDRTSAPVVPPTRSNDFSAWSNSWSTSGATSMTSNQRRDAEMDWDGEFEKKIGIWLKIELWWNIWYDGIDMMELIWWNIWYDGII